MNIQEVKAHLLVRLTRFFYLFLRILYRLRLTLAYSL